MPRAAPLAITRDMRRDAGARDARVMPSSSRRAGSRRAVPPGPRAAAETEKVRVRLFNHADAAQPEHHGGLARGDLPRQSGSPSPRRTRSSPRKNWVRSAWALNTGISRENDGYSREGRSSKSVRAFRAARASDDDSSAP